MNTIIISMMILSVLGNPSQQETIKENGICHAVHMQYGDDAEYQCAVIMGEV